MERLTTDNPKNNQQTLLNYAYAKDHAVHLAFGNDEENIPLDEYIALKASENGCRTTTTEVMEGGCMECDCSIGILNTVAIQAAELRGRLKMIEDILGDTYDLDHLRDLIETERKGLLMARPFKVGDKVYTIEGNEVETWIIKYFGARYDAESMCASAMLNFDLSLAGTTVFKTREEAEAALAKMKEE